MIDSKNPYKIRPNYKLISYPLTSIEFSKLTPPTMNIERKEKKDKITKEGVYLSFGVVEKDMVLRESSRIQKLGKRFLGEKHAQSQQPQ